MAINKAAASEGVVERETAPRKEAISRTTWLRIYFSRFYFCCVSFFSVVLFFCVCPPSAWFTPPLFRSLQKSGSPARHASSLTLSLFLFVPPYPSPPPPPSPSRLQARVSLLSTREFLSLTRRAAGAPSLPLLSVWVCFLYTFLCLLFSFPPPIAIALSSLHFFFLFIKTSACSQQCFASVSESSGISVFILLPFYFSFPSPWTDG